MHEACDIFESHRTRLSVRDRLPHAGDRADAEDAFYRMPTYGGGKVVAALKILHGPERIGWLYHCIARRFLGLNVSALLPTSLTARWGRTRG